MGTSGSEMRKPARAKRLAIQRIAALFSLGTNRRRMAPTSGVKRMMERMWFCIENSSQLPASSIPVSVQKSGREPGVLIGSLRLSVRIIKNKTQQARDHNEGVPLHLSPFEQAEWVGQDACQDRGAVDPEAVDDQVSNHLAIEAATRVLQPVPLTAPSTTCTSNQLEASPKPSTPRRMFPALRRPVKR